MKNIKIDFDTLNDLIYQSNKLLYTNTKNFFVIENFDYITQSKNNYFFITKINILTWNYYTNRWTVLDDKGIKKFFKLIKKYPLSVLRDNYFIYIKNPLNKIEEITNLYD